MAGCTTHLTRPPQRWFFSLAFFLSLFQLFSFFGSTQDVKQALEGVKTLYKSDALYKNHVADGKPMEYHMHNRSTWRQRGYRVGSLYTQPSQEDAYYKQPAHPLAETSEEATFPPNSTEQEYARKGFKKPSGEYDYDGPIESLTDHRH